jgi:hypothetical protein
MSVARAIGFAFLIVALVSMIGCTMAKISGKGEVPMILNQPPAKIETVEKIDHSKHIMFDYTSSFDVSEVLDEVMMDVDADAIINMQIVIKSTFVDFLANLFTLGLASAKTFQVTGTAVRLPEGMSSLPSGEFETVVESTDANDIMTAAVLESRNKATGEMLVRTIDENSAPVYKLLTYQTE